MARKRYAPDNLLQRVIAGLEHNDEQRQADSVVLLLMHGPLTLESTTLEQPTPDPILNVRASLLDFFRKIVRGGMPGQISTHHRMTFEARGLDGRATYEARGNLRDLVILQALMLVYLVGLENVRLCKVWDCGRMFVRHYRREFCSARCQKRAYMRARRANEARAKERRRRRAVRA